MRLGSRQLQDSRRSSKYLSAKIYLCPLNDQFIYMYVYFAHNRQTNHLNGKKVELATIQETLPSRALKFKNQVLRCDPKMIAQARVSYALSV